YLSLLRCGYPARVWNHLTIASQLGGKTDDRRQAARQLAALYEQARYAPEDEPLPAEALAAARRDLCFLAGVAALCPRPSWAGALCVVVCWPQAVSWPSKKRKSPSAPAPMPFAPSSIRSSRSSQWTRPSSRPGCAALWSLVLLRIPAK